MMDWITQLYEDIVQRKLELETAINDARTLFKPWPAKASFDETSNADIEKEQCGAVNKEELHVSEPVLSPEEQQGVSMVDQMLRKAQKAVEIQKKLEEPKRPKPRSVSTKLERNSVNQLPDKIKQNSQDPIPKNNRANDSSKHLAQNSKLNMGPPKQVTHRNRANVSSDNKATISKSATKPGTAVRSSERPRSGSGQKRTMAAHVTAPFQTHPHLTSNKLQTTYRASTAKAARGHNKPGHMTHGRGGHSRNITSLGNVGHKEMKVADINEKHETVTTADSIEVCDTLKDVLTLDSVDDSKCCDTNSNCDNTKVAEKRVESVEEADTKLLSDTEPPDQQQFRLTRDGSSIKVPASLRKCLHQNRKLRQKLFTENVTTKVNSPQMRQDFATMLQQQCADATVHYTQHHARQSEHVLTTLSCLSDMLANLQLDTLSEESSAADILRARKMVEFILVKFHETEEKVHSIDFSILTADNLYRGPIQTTIGPPAAVHSPMFWYKSDCFHDRASQCQFYKYSKYRQLEQYTRLVYDIQLRQLNLDMMDVVYKHVMPLLQSLDSTSSEFIQVLRLAYSMLSSNPNHVPVVVKDTIQDD